MNAIILCGGSQGHGMTLKEEIEDRYHPCISEIPWRFEDHGHQEREFRTKADFSLGKETILQRTVRLLHEQNITDITVAWTYAKPVISGVSFRKVEYRGGAVSTILQWKAANLIRVDEEIPEDDKNVVLYSLYALQ